MIPYAVMAYRATKHSVTGFTPNVMMFGREVSEPVDLVTGLPPDTDTAPSAPEYIQQTRERLELAHRIARDALGESVIRAKRQYDKNSYRTQYKTGDVVWYLVKGTQRARNEVRKFLPSYEGPYFVLGSLDDLVYRIQKGPKTKVKVVHHDQLKPYRCRDPLDNAWVMEQAQRWTPAEVSAPVLDEDSVDPLGLSQLFSNADTEEPPSYTSSDPAVDGSATAPIPPSTSLPPDSTAAEDSQNSGGGVAGQREQRQRSQRQRRSPTRFGEWVRP